MKRPGGTLVLVAAMGWLAGACGGGGGGGPTAPPTPTPPPAPVTFRAAGTPAGLTIYLGKTDGTAQNVLRLEVRANDVTDLYGLGFDLDYPTNLLDYRGGSQTEGGFLSADGSNTQILARQITDGTVIVGLSRLGDVGGVDGSGLLLTLDFTAVSNGTGTFSFVANDAFDGQGDRLDETVWMAGDVTVNLQ